VEHGVDTEHCSHPDGDLLVGRCGLAH
jgi:hypothetical protein